MSNKYTCYNCGEVLEGFDAYYDHVKNICGESSGILQELHAEVNEEEDVNASTEESHMQQLEFASQNLSPTEQWDSAREARRNAFELFLRAGNQVKSAVDFYEVLKQYRFLQQTSEASMEEQPIDQSDNSCLAEVRAEILDAMESEISTLLDARAAIVDYERAGQDYFLAIKNEIRTLVAVLDSTRPNENFYLEVYRFSESNMLQNLISNLGTLKQQNEDQCRSIGIYLYHSERFLANQIAKYNSQGTVTPSTQQEVPSTDTIQGMILNTGCDENDDML